MLRLEDFQQGREAIAVVGLGYVGLPLAVALSRGFQVVGFDVSETRIHELRHGKDRTREVEPEDLTDAGISFTSSAKDLESARLIIVAVPTPIDSNHRPDLHPILGASATVGRHMSPGSIVVYESTVYPGLTEEICAPVLERESGLRCGEDFLLGYSPERINPGDRVHTLENIVKVVAGQNEEVTGLLAGIYGTVVRAGIHKAPAIRVAEAAKVIENTQRDLNIALMNELALIFQTMGIDTLDVLQAAGTKWNFLPFKPGLVGGHCIGVDPYYLTFKAEELNYHPQVILAGRRINDSMGEYVARTVIKKMIQAGTNINGSRIGVLGLTFKENVPDLRNTRVTDIIHELGTFSVEVLVHDPLVDEEEARHELSLELVPWERLQDLDGLILAVPHEPFTSMPLEKLAGCLHDPAKGLLADIKGALPPAEARRLGLNHWRL
jgi:UDP-N-acetyl-D-galactosamine dehydrogenase